MSERIQESKTLAEQAMGDSAKLDKLVEQLSIGSRRERQAASSAIALIANENPDLLAQHIPLLVDALNRPEAQTRWECLDALTLLVGVDSRACEKALVGAEASLFDEESGPVRLAAMKFLCKIGATTSVRSEKVWPLVDEGIQCYHGDLEFGEMLNAIIEFSTGKLSDSVKQSLAERMSFDAANGKGALKRKAAIIVENVSK